MKIKGCKTIEEFTIVRNEKIQKWIDDRFVKGSVTWAMNGANTVKVTDESGDSMEIQLDDIE